MHGGIRKATKREDVRTVRQQDETPTRRGRFSLLGSGVHEIYLGGKCGA